MHGSRKERRRSASRINVRSNQIAYLNFQSGNGGIVLDVSTNGFGFQAVEPLKANEVLPFRLSVPGFPHINLSGRIAWVDESRRRGGLRVTVPEAERRAFRLWQQYLEPQLEAMESAASTPARDVVYEGQLEAKQLRISRNVLVACLLVFLSVALAGGSQFLSTAHRIGDLLSHPDRKSSGASHPGAPAPRDTASVRPAVASRAGQSPNGLREDPKHYDARLFAAASGTTGGKLQSHVNALGTEQVAPTFSESIRPASRLVTSVSATRANSMTGEKGGIFHTAAGALNPRPALQRSGSARAVSMTGPDTHGIIRASGSIAAEQVATMDSSSDSAGAPAASEAFASAVASRDGLSSQTPELATSLEPCQLVSSVQPVYPKEARKQKVEGDVKLRVVVGTDGSVRNVAPVDGPALLIGAAVDATRQFHYKPALLNGKPIETIQTVDVSFKLER
jgi:TonB family protein